MMDLTKMPIQEDHTYDPTRQMIDLAVSCGRKLQSPQTGFVHYFYSKQSEKGHQTIPLYENFLFVLSLLRFRMKHSIEEAKILLPKLLAFQSSDGNFPRYLHDFPKCHDWDKATEILPILYWIQKDYAGILEKELIEHVKNASEKVLEHSWQTQRVRTSSFSIRIKLAASAKALGVLWKDKKLQEKGEKNLAKLLEESQQETFGSWFSPQYIGDTLISLQMAYPDGIEKASWGHFWELLEAVFDPRSCSYVGPSLQDEQYKREPIGTLFDFAAGHLFGKYNYRCFLVHPFQLEAALVHETKDQFVLKKPPYKHQGAVAGYQWEIKREPLYTIATMQKKGQLDASREKRFQPFRLLFGGINKLHTLVCQGGHVSTVDSILFENGVELSILLDGSMPKEERGGVHELCFYTDRDDGVQLFVEGEKATTFKLDDVVTLESDTLCIKLKFQLVEGNGRFLGHLIPSNRPSQRACVGDNRFEAYDWRISLRTVRRFSPCILKVLVQCEQKAD